MEGDETFTLGLLTENRDILINYAAVIIIDSKFLIESSYITQFCYVFFLVTAKQNPCSNKWNFCS